MLAGKQVKQLCTKNPEIYYMIQLLFTITVKNYLVLLRLGLFQKGKASKDCPLRCALFFYLFFFNLNQKNQKELLIKEDSP